jgi:transcriptional regulator with XRE-family HTH domain
VDVQSPKLGCFAALLNLQLSLRLLGERIRETRKVKGLSQEDLAYEAEVDRSYMGGIERGQRNPSFKTLCTIASTLQVDVGTLTSGLPVKK